MGTSLKGLEEPATKFLLAVEVELRQRATEEKIQRTVKSTRGKGKRKLRGLFSSVNYGSTSARCNCNSEERAMIHFNEFEDFILEY